MANPIIRATSQFPDTVMGPDISLRTYEQIRRDIRSQPYWRYDADSDADYYDGAQLPIDVQERLRIAGIPAQDANFIKPTLNTVLGMEAKNRTDFKLSTDNEQQEELVQGLSAKLKEVERKSGCDRACSDAYASQMKAGIGWVEVGREFDPLKYPYRVRDVHRNEIYWDWTSREPDLSDARYLRRDKWIDRYQVLQMFPKKKDVIENSWGGWDSVDFADNDNTELERAFENEQNWGWYDEAYLNHSAGMVRLSELWYRYYEMGVILTLPTGHTIEYNENNPDHVQAVAKGLVQMGKAMVAKVRVSIWLGPHKLMDRASPLPHDGFPYVPFWCFRKDRSRTPYGLVRDMRGPQDQIIDLDILLYEVMNSVKIVVDNDAIDISVNTYKQVADNMANLRAMTVLNAKRMNRPGGFEMKRDHQLTAHIMQLIQERKDRIEQIGGIYKTMLGADTQAKSGRAIDSLVEQGSNTLGEANDNFRYARRVVGNQLAAFVIRDMVGKPSSVKVGNGKQAKMIYFNRPLYDETKGREVIHNNVETVKIDVVLEDVPSTNTFKQQQYRSLAEVAQNAPPEYQMVLYPMLLELSDAPNRHELADQMRQISGVGSQDEQVQKMQQMFEAQMQEMGMQMQELTRALQEAQLKLQDKTQQNQIKAQELQLKDKQVKEDQRIKEEKDEADVTLKAQELALKLKQGAKQPESQRA